MNNAAWAYPFKSSQFIERSQVFVCDEQDALILHSVGVTVLQSMDILLQQREADPFALVGLFDTNRVDADCRRIGNVDRHGLMCQGLCIRERGTNKTDERPGFGLFVDPKEQISCLRLS